MITFKSRDDQVKFINDFMNRLIHHRYAENMFTYNQDHEDPYVYHRLGIDIFVSMTALSVGVQLQLTIGCILVLHRSFCLIEADPLEVVTLAFIDFCQRAEAIEKILKTPQEGE